MSNSNAILSANGGLHSKRAMKKVKDRLQNHGMKRSILVQFVLTGSQSVKVYRDTYNDIADHIRDNGSRCEYFGCLEVDEVKGLHSHVYFVIETIKKFPHKTLDVTDGAWLHKLAERRGLVNDDGTTRRIHIAQPQNKMHNSHGRKQFFARLDDEAKLADCLERIEYLYKNRSKANVPCREIYFNSNFEANKAKRTAKKKPVPVTRPAALPAAHEASISLDSEKVVIPEAEGNSETTTKGDDMQLTEAGFKYLATQYETCVDLGMNVVQIQSYLSSKGISRSLKEVKHELNSVYCFAGYVDAHPAPPRDDLALFDAAVSRTPLMSGRAIAFSQDRRTDTGTPSLKLERNHSYPMPHKCHTTA
jgi:hypothetical protein